MGSDEDREFLLRVATEVEAGLRPRSDLEKYGLTTQVVATGDEAKAMLLAELGEEDELDDADEFDDPGE